MKRKSSPVRHDGEILQSGSFGCQGVERLFLARGVPSGAVQGHGDQAVWEEISVMTDVCFCVRLCVVQATGKIHKHGGVAGKRKMDHPDRPFTRCSGFDAAAV